MIAYVQIRWMAANCTWLPKKSSTWTWSCATNSWKPFKTYRVVVSVWIFFLHLCINTHRDIHIFTSTHTYASTLHFTLAKRLILNWAVILGHLLCAILRSPLFVHPVWFGSAYLQAGWRWLQRLLLRDAPRWEEFDVEPHPLLLEDLSARVHVRPHHTASEQCRSSPATNKQTRLDCISKIDGNNIINADHQ